jgi:hypothetical protein
MSLTSEVRHGWSVPGNVLPLVCGLVAFGPLAWFYVKLGGFALLVLLGALVALGVAALLSRGLIAWLRWDSEPESEADFGRTYRRMWRQFYLEAAFSAVAVAAVFVLLGWVLRGWPGWLGWPLTFGVTGICAVFTALWLHIDRKPEDIETEYECRHYPSGGR